MFRYNPREGCRSPPWIQPSVVLALVPLVWGTGVKLERGTLPLSPARWHLRPFWPHSESMWVRYTAAVIHVRTYVRYCINFHGRGKWLIVHVNELGVIMLKYFVLCLVNPVNTMAGRSRGYHNKRKRRNWKAKYSIIFLCASCKLKKTKDTVTGVDVIITGVDVNTIQ
jgi:hypothetical protein